MKALELVRMESVTFPMASLRLLLVKFCSFIVELIVGGLEVPFLVAAGSPFTTKIINMRP